MRKHIISALFFATLPHFAFADGWTGQFIPTGPYIAGIDNYHFRVFGVPASAGCAQNFIYVSGSDPALKTFSASLLLAILYGKQIDAYVTKDGGSWCRIVELNTNVAP